MEPELEPEPGYLPGFEIDTGAVQNFPESRDTKPQLDPPGQFLERSRNQNRNVSQLHEAGADIRAVQISWAPHLYAQKPTARWH